MSSGTAIVCQNNPRTRMKESTRNHVIALDSAYK